jgi:hypothetical protein
VRKDLRIWVQGSQDCEKEISRQLEESVGHSRVSEWSTGGTKRSYRDLAARSPEVLAIRIRESRSAGEPRFVWTRGRA